METTKREIDILSLKFSQFYDMSEMDRTIVFLRVMSPGKLRDLELLKKRIMEFIHWRCVEGKPSTVAGLSRRYSKVLKSLNTDINEVIEELAESGKIVVKQKRKAILISTAVWDEITEMHKDDLTECYLQQEQLLSNAE